MCEFLKEIVDWINKYIGSLLLGFGTLFVAIGCAFPEKNPTRRHGEERKRRGHPQK